MEKSSVLCQSRGDRRLSPPSKVAPWVAMEKSSDVSQSRSERRLPPPAKVAPWLVFPHGEDEPSEFQLQLRKDLLKSYSYNLNLPDDISEIVHKFFPWQTYKDVENTVSYYYRVSWGQFDPKFDVHAELSKLEDFSAILGRLCDSCLEVCLENEKRLAQPFNALVEQMPSIKDDPSYESLTTDFEKCEIENALEQKPPKELIQVKPQSLCSHLEVLRRELQKVDNDKILEAHRRMSTANHLHNRVNRMTEALKSALKAQEIENEFRDFRGFSRL